MYMLVIIDILASGQEHMAQDNVVLLVLMAQHN